MTPTFKRLLRAFRHRLLQILYAVPALLIRRLGVRFVSIMFTERIGHLAVEIDWILKRRALGEVPVRHLILLLHRKVIANQPLLDAWSRRIAVIKHRLPTSVLKHFTMFPALTIDLGPAVNVVEGAADYPRVTAAWGERPPLFELPDALNRRGEAALREMGIPTGAWWVCVHSRDSVYAPRDEAFHTYRNSDITSYSLAVDEIIRRGGWCIRMGERATRSLAERPGLVNYAATSWKSDWMDIFLCVRARFFLGNSSGLCVVAAIAGVPSALAHMAPLGACYGVHPRDIAIPKLLRSAEGHVLSFPEILASDLSVFRFSERFVEAGVSFIENTPEQVRELAIEMLDVLDGVPCRSPEDEERQRRFRGLMTPRHYMSAAVSRIGSAFLREHERLLEWGSPAVETTAHSVARSAT